MNLYKLEAEVELDDEDVRVWDFDILNNNGNERSVKDRSDRERKREKEEKREKCEERH
jgi:hypothetical protein